MFLSSLIEELCTKEENNKAGCTFTFGGQCKIILNRFFFFVCVCLEIPMKCYIFRWFLPQVSKQKKVIK